MNLTLRMQQSVDWVDPKVDWVNPGTSRNHLAHSCKNGTNEQWVGSTQGKHESTQPWRTSKTQLKNALWIYWEGRPKQWLSRPKLESTQTLRGSTQRQDRKTDRKWFSGITERVDPRRSWVDPSELWVDPKNGWVDPSEGWVDPRTGWADPNTGWT